MPASVKTVLTWLEGTVIKQNLSFFHTPAYKDSVSRVLRGMLLFSAAGLFCVEDSKTCVIGKKKKKTTTTKKKPHYRLSPASGAWITWQHISLAFHVNRRGLHSKWHRVMINMPVFVLLPTVSQHTGSCKFITSLFSLFLSLSPLKKVTYLKLTEFFLALSGREKGESGGGQLQSSSPMHLCFKCSLCKPRSGTFSFSFFFFFLCSRSVMCPRFQMKWITVKAAGTFFFFFFFFLHTVAAGFL